MKKFLSIFVALSMVLWLFAGTLAPRAGAATGVLTDTTKLVMLNYFNPVPVPLAATVPVALASQYVYKMGDVIHGSVTFADVVAGNAYTVKLNTVTGATIDVVTGFQVAGITTYPFQIGTGNVSNDGPYDVAVADANETLTAGRVYIQYNLTWQSNTIGSTSGYSTIGGWLTRGNGQTVEASVTVGVTYPDNTLAATYIVAGHSSGQFSLTFPATQIGTYRVYVRDGYPVALTPDNDAMIYDRLSNIPGAVAVTLTSPNGGESWVPGTVYNITWTVTGDPSAIHHFSLYYTVDGGNSWERAGAGYAGSTARSFSWAVPARFSSHAKVIVYAMNAASALQAYDASDFFFTIAPGAGTLPAVTLSHPSGETWTAGTIQMISWSVSSPLPASFHHFSVYASLEDGRNGSWFLVGYSPTPPLAWAIPGTKGSAHAKIVVYAMDVHSNLLADAVLASFIITPVTGAYDFAVTAPVSGATLHVGVPASVTWATTIGTIPSQVFSCKVYYSVDGGLSWEYAGAPPAPPFSWTVPARLSSACTVMVVATDVSGNVLGVATSSAFTIAP